MTPGPYGTGSAVRPARAIIRMARQYWLRCSDAVLVNAERGDSRGGGHDVLLVDSVDGKGQAETDAAVCRDYEFEESVDRRGVWRAFKALMSMTAGMILAVVALLAVVVAVGTNLSADRQLGLFGHPVMSVLSGSMAPTINTGDLVIDAGLTPAHAAGLHAGQIISFRPDAGSHRIFTHRIAAVETLPGGGVGYVTKGDANDSRDTRVTPSTNVIGLYQSKIPRGGYILDALHRPLVLGLLLAAPLLWLLSEPLRKWAREAEEPVNTTETEGDDSPS